MSVTVHVLNLLLRWKGRQTLKAKFKEPRATYLSGIAMASLKKISKDISPIYQKSIIN